MGSEELADKVRRWLKESGQALELGTARTLQRAGLPVVESFHYADPTTREQREGDVLVHAAKDWFRHDLMVAIECKHASAKPWVAVREAVRRAKSASSPGDWFVYEGSDPDDLLGDAVGAGVLPMEPVCGRVVTALSQDGGHNTAYDATRQALSAAIGRGVEAKRFERRNGSAGVSINAAVLAVVVTTAPLFTAQLNSGGQIDLHEVPWFEVMTDVGKNRDRHPVIVMSPTHVATWANALKSIL